MSFTEYAANGFTTELLPIIPPGAPISASSKILPEQVGKIPGKRASDGWVGYAGWTQLMATAADVARWDTWNCGVGVQGRRFPAIDIDVDHKELADAIELEVMLALGLAPCRYGRGERRLLVFAADGLQRRRLGFTFDGSSEVHAVELLGAGQQWIAEGTHPRTGEPYGWRGGHRPNSRRLVEITAAELDALFASVAWLVENLFGGADLRLEGTRGRDHDDRGRDEGVDGGDAVRPAAQADLLEPAEGAVERLLASAPNTESYDGWIRILTAIKSAAGEDAFDAACAWSCQHPDTTPDLVRYKWDSLAPPYRVGWPQLSAWGTSLGLSPASEEFEPVSVDDALAAMFEEPAGGDDRQARMFEQYAWIEGAKRAVEIETGDLLDQEQFEFRIPPYGRSSSWKVLKDNPGQRTSFKNLTFRPGSPRIVTEHLPDLDGPCFNIWRAPVYELPEAADDDDVRPWLDLAALVVPNEIERAHVLDWMAFTAQHPGAKIHHALVLGSRVEGIGKDTLIEPLRVAIGRRYTREIGPQHLARDFNAWVVGAKLVIVQEMHNFERKETMNRLKPYVAAPPDALPVNMKHRQEFFVPNLMSTLFFTNEDDALALSRGDRRYFITWNDGEPQPKAFYDAVWDWMRAGGAEKAVRWLLSRDVTRFDAKGRAPGTEAKEMMRKEARGPLQEFIEDAIDTSAWPFDRDLIVAEDVIAAIPEYARYKGQRPGPHKVAKVLRAVGAECLTDKIRVDGLSGSRRIWAVRRLDMYRNLTDDKLRELFLDQRAKAETRNFKETERDFG